MFSKLIKKVFKETTNIADITTATFNVTGNYNPRYGKQHVYVSGRGGTGTTIPGSDYDNSYTNAGVVTPASYTAASYYITANTEYGYNFHNANAYNDPSGNWYAYENAYASYYVVHGINIGSYAFNTPVPEKYFGPYPGTASGFPMTFNGNYSTGTLGNTTPESYTPASYTPGNYVPGNSGTYATNYTTGGTAYILGISLPGGVGGAATVVPPTLISNPKYGTTTAITIPTGGYTTITFTL